LDNITCIVRQKFPQFHHVYNASITEVVNHDGFQSGNATHLMCFRADSGTGKEWIRDTVIVELDEEMNVLTSPYLLSKMPGFNILEEGSDEIVAANVDKWSHKSLRPDEHDLHGNKFRYVFSKGPEDARLFTYDNTSWFIFNLGEKDRRAIYLYSMRDQRMIRLYISNCKTENSVEKNWMPMVPSDPLKQGGTIQIVYCPDPLVLGEVNLTTGETILQCGNEEKQLDVLPKTEKVSLRGGTPYLEIEEGLYVGFCHQMCRWDGLVSYGELYGQERYITFGYKYNTHLLVLSNDKIVYRSEKLNLCDVGIEYVSGMTRIGDNYTLSIGVNDTRNFIQNIGNCKEFLRLPRIVNCESRDDTI
jgi:hypothetical protein